MSYVKRFTFCEEDNFSIVEKKNEVINLEMGNKALVVSTSTELQQATPLSTLETMLIHTAFGLADYIKRKQPGTEYDANTEFCIDMQQFARIWKMDKEYVKTKSFDGLIRRAIKKVDSRRLRYNTFPEAGKRQGTVYSGYFGSIKYFGSQETGGEVVFVFPKDLIPYMRAPGNFSWYYFENMVSLKENSNAMLLFEYFSRYKNHHNKSLRISHREFHIQMSMDEVRQYLTISDGYSNTDLYRKVLVSAADFITFQTNSLEDREKPNPLDRSGISVNVRKVKEGRELKAAVFEVTFSNRELDRPGALKILKLNFPLLNSAQVIRFGTKLNDDDEFKKRYIRPDEDDFQFISRIYLELGQNENVILYYEYLKKYGYQNKELDPK